MLHGAILTKTPLRSKAGEKLKGERAGHARGMGSRRGTSVVTESEPGDKRMNGEREGGWRIEDANGPKRNFTIDSADAHRGNELDDGRGIPHARRSVCLAA